MKVEFLSKRFLGLWRAVLVLALPALIQAQDPFPTPPPPPDPLAGVPVQVLDQQQVTIGTTTSSEADKTQTGATHRPCDEAFKRAAVAQWQRGVPARRVAEGLGVTTE